MAEMSVANGRPAYVPAADVVLVGVLVAAGLAAILFMGGRAPSRRDEERPMPIPADDGAEGDARSPYDDQRMRVRLVRRLQALDQQLEAKPHDRPGTLREIAWAERQLAEVNSKLGLG